MGLIIIEGLDRVGKTSVARFYEDQGYEYIHMSAPPKGQTPDIFLEEMMEIVQLATHKDIVLDRSWYGESCIWPKIYDRESICDESNLDILRELEDTVGVQRILMHDPNSEAHWQRCVDNKEPLTKMQFVKARALYSSMADKYGFERKTIKDFPNADQPLPVTVARPQLHDNPSAVSGTKDAASKAEDNKTKEQLKLERANTINEVLSKRILKGKGQTYDDLERSMRSFLNTELGKIFGNGEASISGLSNEEVNLLKFFCKRLKEKSDG